MTRAPKSASTRVHIGAETACSRATTVMPVSGPRFCGITSVAPRHSQDVLAQEIENHLLTACRNLHQPRLTEVPRHVVLLRVAHPAVQLQRPIGRCKSGIRT